MAELIKALGTSILRGDVETYQRLLTYFPWAAMTLDERMKVVIFQAMTILDNQTDMAQDLLKSVFTEWTKYSPENCHIMGELLRSTETTDDFIRHVANVLDFNFYDFVVALSVYNDSALNAQAVVRMDTINCQQTAEDYKEAIEFLEPSISDDGKITHVNEYLLGFLRERYRLVSPLANKPTYFIEKDNIEWTLEDGSDDPASKHIILPTPDEAAELIVESMVNELLADVSYEERVSMLEEIKTNYIRENSDRMKIRFLQPVINKLTGVETVTDIERFRQWGPANPYIVPHKYAIDTMSSRMLTCIRYVDEGEEIDYLPNDPEKDYWPFDWFTGSCDQCYKRIPAYHHAVRMPVEDGGWLGCYCSWKCVIKNMPVEDEIVKQVSPYPMRARLVRIFAKQLEEYGLYDRPIMADEPNLDDGRQISAEEEALILQAIMDAEGSEE